MNCPQCAFQLAVVRQYCPNCDHQLLFVSKEKAAPKRSFVKSFFRILNLTLLAGAVFLAVAVGGSKLINSGLLGNKTNMEICGGFNQCYRELYVKDLNESKSLQLGTRISL